MKHDLCLGNLGFQIPVYPSEEGLIGIGPSAVMAGLLRHDKIPGLFVKHLRDADISVRDDSVFLILIRPFIPFDIAPVALEGAAPDIEIHNKYRKPHAFADLVQISGRVAGKAVSDGQNIFRHAIFIRRGIISASSKSSYFQ